jgi:N-methylhydantoinase A
VTFAIGIDVGGTFTDVVAADDAGAVTFAKAATTPADQSEGVLDGLRLLAEQLGLDLPALLAATGRIVHGTTVATNALLESKTARVGMLVTEGHRDVIEMREGLKPDRYDLRQPSPTDQVPRRLRLPVRERLRADGSVETPLDAGSLHAALDVLAAERVEAVAVCFLHSWRNPAHERAAAAAARARLPDAFVTASHEVLPEIKEFERFGTTVANAAVGPVVRRYLHRLSERLEASGFAGPLLVMLSHGGVASVEEATRLAAGTALSGPAGGVAAALALAGQGVGGDVLTFDMGGTSTDIALVREGRPYLSAARGVGAARIALPSLDMVTLGAGGGSIGHLSRSGLLQVGPESAGADPGPACYGRGGEQPTVTDANLVLGYLDPATFLGGRRVLDAAAAGRAVAGLGERLGLGPVATAAGIHRVVNARMADGLRVATVRRGVDPRGFVLLAFGGAAGLHVAAVAAELGIARVCVPIEAAVLSAWGMLNTDLRVELTRSLPQEAGIDVAALAAAFAGMAEEGRARLAWFGGEVTQRRRADMRYGEQVFTIEVPLDGLDWSAPGLGAGIAEAFHQQHEALFTYALRDQEPVLVNARLAVTGRLPSLPARQLAARPPAPSGTRRAHLGGWRDLDLYRLEALAPGQRVPGPALVESDSTTILLRATDSARFDTRGWLEIAVGARRPD